MSNKGFSIDDMPSVSLKAGVKTKKHDPDQWIAEQYIKHQQQRKRHEELERSLFWSKVSAVSSTLIIIGLVLLFIFWATGCDKYTRYMDPTRPFLVFELAEPLQGYFDGLDAESSPFYGHTVNQVIDPCGMGRKHAGQDEVIVVLDGGDVIVGYVPRTGQSRTLDVGVEYTSRDGTHCTYAINTNEEDGTLSLTDYFNPPSVF